MASAPHDVIIYTDGGCVPNPGVGGWGAVLICGEKVKELSGGDAATTNNRMELTAAVEALRALKRPCTVQIHTDSNYLKNGITQWLPRWKRRNWRTTTGPVKNADLWRLLDDLNAQHKVQWHWVQGHAGDYFNERCDDLAREAIVRQRQ